MHAKSTLSPSSRVLSRVQADRQAGLMSFKTYRAHRAFRQLLLFNDTTVTDQMVAMGPFPCILCIALPRSAVPALAWRCVASNRVRCPC